MIHIKIVKAGVGQTVLMPFDEDGNAYCPVCGTPHLDDPAYDLSGAVGWGICPKCDVEFGVEDSPLHGEDIKDMHKELRKKWLDRTGYQPEDLQRLQDVFGIDRESWTKSE